MKFSNKVYDVLKFIALVGLPALAVAYVGFGNLWEWPNTEKVASSIIILDTLLGALLQISNAKYNKDDENFEGYLNPNGQDPDTGLPNLQLVVTKHPKDILHKKTARLKIGDAPVEKS